MALGEGHVLQPGGDLLAEVANAPFQLPLCGAASLFEFSDPYQLGHPLRQRALAALQVSQGDGAGLVSVEDPALLGT